MRFTRCSLLCAALLIPAAAAQTGWIIETTAGSGNIGDGGAATAAQLRDISGVAVDGAGNIYIADQGNHRIRKVNPKGVITTAAGVGHPGYSGDGGAATAAQLNSPYGVTADDAGNLYIADWGNRRIRRVDASSGNISTVAGTGVFGGDGDGGAATAAQLNFPAGAAVDSEGNLYIADMRNQRIRKVDTAGVITTVAGNGTRGYSGDGGAATAAQLNDPRGAAVDGAGNLYIADWNNRRIRKVDAKGVITTVAGGGKLSGSRAEGAAATEARLGQVYGAAVDAAGNLYIADGGSRIRKVDATGVITTVAGSRTSDYSGDGGAATAAQLNSPRGVAADDSGNIYIADAGSSRIRKVDKAGVITTVAGTRDIGDGGAAAAARLNSPHGLAADGAGNLYIADWNNRRIRKVNAKGAITTVAGGGTLSGSRAEGAAAADVRLGQVYDAAVDAAGNLYIADGGGSRIRKVDAAGVITTIAGNGRRGYSGDEGAAEVAQLNSPSGVAADGDGNLYIADSGNHRIRKIDASSGHISTIAGTGTAGYSGDGGAATAAQLNSPRGMAVDGAGNLYIADWNNRRVRKVDPKGAITTVAGGGTLLTFFADGGAATAALLGQINDVAADASGNLYISDLSTSLIRKVDASSGHISTIAGTGTAGYSGDGGAAEAAQLNLPNGLAVDGAGNIYIADSGNHRIRRLTRKLSPRSDAAGQVADDAP